MEEIYLLNTTLFLWSKILLGVTG